MAENEQLQLILEGRVAKTAHNVFAYFQHVLLTFEKLVAKYGGTVRVQTFHLGSGGGVPSNILVFISNSTGEFESRHTILLYPRALFDTFVVEGDIVGGVDKRRIGLDFQFYCSYMAAAIENVIRENKKQRTSLRMKHVRVRLDYAAKQISLFKWKNVIDGVESVNILHASKAETYYNRPREQQLPTRYVQTDLLRELYDQLKALSYDITQITMSPTECVLDFGGRLEPDKDAYRLTFLVSRDPEGGDTDKIHEWRLRVKSFTKLYENLLLLPDPKPVFYFGSAMLMYQLLNEDGAVVARVTHRLDDTELPGEETDDDGTDCDGSISKPNDSKYNHANDGCSSDGTSSSIDYPDEDFMDAQDTP